MAVAPGHRLGPYELIALIGSGGMGEVWRALDPGLRRHVAIKILPTQYSRDPDRLRRFEHEAQAAGMLNHPNVLSVYAIGQQDDAPYLVTELLDGVTLRQRLTSGPLSESKALEYADQLVQGLVAAHDKGIVHRDLKPDNVFITREDRVKILDFGLAKLATAGPEYDAQTRTATGMVVGTPAYMAPEQVRGQSADQRTDVFAVGALLYEMLAGRRAFVGDTSAETMTAILKQEPPPVAGVSAQVEQIVQHCLEKVPGDRYQSARDLAFQLRVVRQPSAAIAPLPSIMRRPLFVIAVVGVILVAGAATLVWWLKPPDPWRPAASFRRLTPDSGLTTDPAFSPDGKLVAYASDRDGATNLDIWRQEIETGEAVRLTSDPADEHEPAFSPDGNRIAFRSEGNGGGIWIVSVFGGEPRLIARHGRRPRFSPDGTRIAYWVGRFFLGEVYTIPVTGGDPTRVQPGFASALNPVWSADGRKLLFQGASDPQHLPGDAFDWWLAPVDGGPAVKTGALDILRRQRIWEGRLPLASAIAPADWIGDDVVFSGASNESTNLWRVPVAQATGKAEGSAERLTSGTSTEVQPSAIPGGRIAFANVTNTVNIWSVNVAADTGKITSAPQQVTSAAVDAGTSVSADGTKLVFISTRLGNPDVWLKDLESGKETALTQTPARESNAELTADGSRVVYSVSDGPRGVLYQVSTTGGPAERICEHCGLLPWDSSPDGRFILYLIGEGQKQTNSALGLFDVARRATSDYLVQPEYGPARVRFSPDGNWISFVAINAAGSHVAIAPFREKAPPRLDEWIAMTKHQRIIHDKPRWSPDGRFLYYISDVDGFPCIWAQRLDHQTKRPVGPPMAVSHWHSARRALMKAGMPFYQELSLSTDKLFFNVEETTGNIWMAEWKR